MYTAVQMYMYMIRMCTCTFVYKYIHGDMIHVCLHVLYHVQISSNVHVYMYMLSLAEHTFIEQTVFCSGLQSRLRSREIGNKSRMGISIVALLCLPESPDCASYSHTLTWHHRVSISTWTAHPDMCVCTCMVVCIFSCITTCPVLAHFLVASAERKIAHLIHMHINCIAGILLWAH